MQRQIGLGFEESVQRESLLDKELRNTKAEFDRLNASSFQYKTLKREADADRKLYEELVAKTKQATINAGFPNSAIRIADLARPGYAPVSPNIPVNVLLAVTFGLMLAVGIALLADALDSTVRDPETVSTVLGSDVLGTLPKVRGAAGALVPAMLRESGVPTGTPQSRALMRVADAAQKPALSYLESVKTLHASLMLADVEQRVRSMMVTSAAPAEGKSTVATAIAISHAAKGKRVLLIDGDLRRPSIADKLGISTRQGVVDVCLRGAPWRELVHPMAELPNLQVLPTGACNRRAIDSFAPALSDLLAEATVEYDLVIVDSPPLLGFPEPLHVASLVDGVLLVALSGSTNRKALQMAIGQLRRIGAQTLGVVLNGATRDNQGAYYYHHYSSHYAHGEASQRFEDETKEKLAS
ncbi:MAG: AAA family ATPase [Bryobacterales bacterium]|nr:AAA family ATPase [Bryobacterales bacterium]